MSIRKLGLYAVLASLTLSAACARTQSSKVVADAAQAPLINVRLLDADRHDHVLTIFDDNIIHFTPADSLRYETAQVSAADKGRRLWTQRELRALQCPTRIIARVETRPIPQTIQTVHDPWDRAGSVALVRPGEPTVEILKFMTAYGGVTAHEADVSWLAPLLTGPIRFEGFVDTWSSPGWEMDFSLEFTPDPGAANPSWAMPLFNAQAVTRASMDQGAISVAVTVPPGHARLELLYFVSGHCTDGRGADEFESKDNVLHIDGVESLRFRPWRDDCGRFRAINPYCRRWSDGTWSSDYSRSGWCPGDQVPPHRFDLSAALPAGEHYLEFAIEDIRPRDAEGNFGYWRVSALLVGWEE